MIYMSDSLIGTDKLQPNCEFYMNELTADHFTDGWSWKC